LGEDSAHNMNPRVNASYSGIQGTASHRVLFVGKNVSLKFKFVVDTPSAARATGLDMLSILFSK
jgi:hypothetical protein